MAGSAAPAMCPAETSNVVVPTGTAPCAVACRSTSARSTGRTEHLGAVRQPHEGGIGTAPPERNMTSVLVNVERNASVQKRVTSVTTRNVAGPIGTSRRPPSCLAPDGAGCRCGRS